MQKVSCIICAYNEEKSISGVLYTLLHHPLIDEIIVVDDGSTDQTRELVEFHKRTHHHDEVTLELHEKNRGKSTALVTGVRKAKNDLLLFLDADLVGLTKDDVTALIEPVTSGRADLTLSLKANSLDTYKMLGIDHVSGERVFPKSLILDHLDVIASLPGFGVETYINELIVQKGLRIKIVPWPTVAHLRKADKYGFWRGNWGELKMTWEIRKILPFRKIVRQIYRMRKLSRV